jgi:hypothetical protein
MDNSMRHNGHPIVDELCPLKIFRASHPSYSPDISPYDCWMFGYFQGRQTDCDLQCPEEILTILQKSSDNVIFEEFQMVLESWRDRLRWIIEHDGEYFRE